MAKMLAELRAAHPSLIFSSYDWQLVGSNLEITFSYRLEPAQSFATKLVIEKVTAEQLASVPEAQLRALLLNLGLVEAFSYWKTACPPTIEVQAGWLSQDQLSWWREVLIQGFGEFFYVNDIDFTAPDFVRLISTGPQLQVSTIPAVLEQPTTQVLVPMGGGKDSVVTAQIVKQHSSALCLLIKPTEAALNVTKELALPYIKVDRQLDPALHVLNEQGYLNGHVPISAVYAWTSLVVARLWNIPQVLVSNERSSNEGNVMYHGTEINHQFSKTFIFEQGLHRYLLADPLLQTAPHYLSFLRPLFELQIARLFVDQTTSQPQLRQQFRSCNRGQKTNSWCGDCPKCLFAFSILYPFLSYEEIVGIFGQDLFAKAELTEMAMELIGARPQKPLECVGTREENTAAFYLCIQKCHSEHRPLPIILEKIEQEVLANLSKLPERTQQVLTSWNPHHQLSEAQIAQLQSAVAHSQAHQPLPYLEEQL